MADEIQLTEHEKDVANACVKILIMAVEDALGRPPRVSEILTMFNESESEFTELLENQKNPKAILAFAKQTLEELNAKITELEKRHKFDFLKIIQWARKNPEKYKALEQRAENMRKHKLN